MTYMLLNLVFLVVTAAVFIARRPNIRPKHFFILLSVMLLLTAIFDNLIIHFGVVAYNADTITGWYIWKAPIEDFSYTIAVCLLVPTLMRKKQHEDP